MLNDETIRRNKKYRIFYEALIVFLNERSERNATTYIVNLAGFICY